MYRRWGKRSIDICLVFIGIIVLSPVLMGIAILIKLDSKGPVFFKQKRVGKEKRHFSIYKFRTMYIDTPKDKPTHLLEDPNQFITKIGRFLRKTSLDELPQLFNVLRGKMSLIGPRPALWNQEDLIKERDLYGANDICPGVTGWAQINGRDELAISEKARLDGEYIERISFKFDAECLFKTFTCILTKDGVKEGGPDKVKQSPILKSEVKKMTE